jgi:hypothetical protein
MIKPVLFGHVATCSVVPASFLDVHLFASRDRWVMAHFSSRTLKFWKVTSKWPLSNNRLQQVLPLCFFLVHLGLHQCVWHLVTSVKAWVAFQAHWLGEYFLCGAWVTVVICGVTCFHYCREEMSSGFKMEIVQVNRNLNVLKFWPPASVCSPGLSSSHLTAELKIVWEARWVFPSYFQSYLKSLIYSSFHPLKSTSSLTSIPENWMFLHYHGELVSFSSL